MSHPQTITTTNNKREFMKDQSSCNDVGCNDHGSNNNFVDDENKSNEGKNEATITSVDDSSTTTFAMKDVDISRNYGHGTVAVPGRESHTADLNEFDRYIKMMENMDRIELDELMMGRDDDDEGEVRMMGEEKVSEHVSNSQVPPDDDLPAGKGSNVGTGPQYPFRHAFWSHIRSILSNAKPVGYKDLPNPDEAMFKGPSDANAFLSKVLALGPINPIQPIALARSAGFDEMEVLAELLYANTCGLVAMRFAPECVRCGSAVMDTDMLGRVPSRALCNGCNALNEIDSLDKIKVIFLLNSDVLYILAENYACTPSALSMSHTSVFAAAPATSTGSGFCYAVGTGKDTEIAPALEPGKYRMHCPVAKTDNYLVVRKPCSDKDEAIQLKMKVSDLIYSHQKGQKRTELIVPHGKIKFEIYPDTRSFFVLWVQKDKDDKTLLYLPDAERTPYTSASMVMHHPVFIALFQEHQVVSVPKNIFLSVSNVVLVFTDIVDSTALYAALGDGEAFHLVRKHFQVLFGAFTRRGGRVVKTIGDAVMASFTTGRAALQAVADAMELLPSVGVRPDRNTFVEIKVGIHSGRATVVPLNGVNDYFGQTANIAARVQSVAKASECFVTEKVLEESQDAKDAYNELTTKLGSSFEPTPLTELTLKGVHGKVQARGFRWVRRDRRNSMITSATKRADEVKINPSNSTYRERMQWIIKQCNPHTCNGPRLNK